MLKRLAILVIAIVLLSSNATYAGFGVHLSIDPDSDTCTGCHRGHIPITEQGIGVENALNTAALASDETTEYEFCITCHGPDATGADNDIVYGVYRNADNTYGTYNEPLNSGGFSRMGGLNGPEVTSTHAIDGGIYTAFGSSTSSSFTMTCTTCHDPDGSTNYRLLRDTINGKDVRNYIASNEPGFQTESATMPKSPKGFSTYVPNYTTTNYKKSEDASKGMAGWCTACHDQYMSLNNTYTSDGKERLHHSINVRIGNNPDGITEISLPLDKPTADTPDNDPDNNMECLTCHRAHGTTATMTDNARVEPTKNIVSSGPGYSALLRLDNRGVCEVCHNK